MQKVDLLIIRKMCNSARMKEVSVFLQQFVVIITFRSVFPILWLVCILIVFSFDLRSATKVDDMILLWVVLLFLLTIFDLYDRWVHSSFKTLCISIIKIALLTWTRT